MLFRSEGDDPLGPQRLGGQDGAQAHRAVADDGDRLAGAGLGGHGREPAGAQHVGGGQQVRHHLGVLGLAAGDPHVESGLITLIGATTENPYFEVNRALLSRSRIFELKPLSEESLNAIIDRVLTDPERGYGGREIVLDEAARRIFLDLCNGDARSLLNGIELAVESTEPDGRGGIVVTRGIAEESIQKRAVSYDKAGDYHYDTISAFIKSLRGSDPDATTDRKSVV